MWVSARHHPAEASVGKEQTVCNSLPHPARSQSSSSQPILHPIWGGTRGSPFLVRLGRGRVPAPAPSLRLTSEWVGETCGEAQVDCGCHWSLRPIRGIILTKREYCEGPVPCPCPHFVLYCWSGIQGRDWDRLLDLQPSDEESWSLRWLLSVLGGPVWVSLPSFWVSRWNFPLLCCLAQYWNKMWAPFVLKRSKWSKQVTHSVCPSAWSSHVLQLFFFRRAWG